MIELHENHPSSVRMKALARSYVWWPNIDSAIEMAVKFCKSSQMNQTMQAKAPIHPLGKKQQLPEWGFILILLFLVKNVFNHLRFIFKMK